MLRVACVALVLLGSVVACRSVAQDTVLDASSVEAWRDHVLPDGDELAFASIPWHPTFGEGMAAANAADKPMLMWAMNGHPLGCT